jgi:hypothetical protein
MSGADSGPRTRAAAAEAVGEQRADGPSARRADAGSGAAAPVQYPAALLYGPGHLVVHGNPPFREVFGAGWVGLPAAEALLDLPRAAFELMDLVYREGRPFARWITLRGAPWRLTVAERRDPGTGDVYGIAVHLVPRERD